MKRKVISVLLCAGTVFSLVSCSGSMGGSGGETADNETGGSNGNSGTVTLLSWYTEEEMSPIKEGFENANPGLTLEVQYVPPTEQYIQKLTLLMNGNEPTDLFFMCPEVREDVEATDFAEDLSDMPIMNKLSDNAKRTLGTDMYKIPIVLFHKQGLSYQEIADITKEPLSKVKNRIFRGRKMLKDILTGKKGR